MIFTLSKTNVKLSFSFVALVVLMLLLCDEIIVFLSLISSIVHESGHLFFMSILGDVPEKIELTMFGMRIDRQTTVKVSYKKDVIISLGGIIFNVIFAAVCYILYIFTDCSILLVVITVNIVIACVNSFPVSALDCARALRSLLLIYYDNSECEKITRAVSYIFVVIFFLSSTVYISFCGTNISLIILNVYLIIITVIKKWS